MQSGAPRETVKRSASGFVFWSQRVDSQIVALLLACWASLVTSLERFCPLQVGDNDNGNLMGCCIRLLGLLQQNTTDWVALKKP